MRHAVFGRKLGRDTNARQALLGNLASSLIASGRLTTTLAKAKFARAYVEKLITVARKNGLAQKRIIANKLSSPAFQKLTKEIAPSFKDRAGGYSRIIKLAPRRGDAAPMARLELIKVGKKTEKPLTVESIQKKSVARKQSKSHHH
ncbi:50S ribosomal protein L17 [Candidatus Curtissbacteria bacterium RIFCSPHIGHO2_01_FULL_41_11]|uniref:50S ribosomal protein L17 n=1 Tax=Candidatus Curtissbacteria bacterium RIFCSPHIGHO2_01_FULL_41_11 TaxID=1797711 RepID=A0A1F5G3E9_9BACT|nr:MAG: 50S ribosomal protein L17 [Candidatus Curtissbacteria bacterium RIFCSPHIGHO2_01_FULL_41_11]